MVRFLLEKGVFMVRAVTRNPKSPAAEALTSQGVDVVKGDMNDEALTRSAIAGSYAVYSMTNTWCA